DDEVKVLQRRLVQHAAARLVDGDIAEALTLQPPLERRLVVIAPVHGNPCPGPPSTPSRTRAVAVTVADSLHETALLVRQCRHPLALYLREQLVEARLVGGPLLLVALGLGLAATLQPALEPALAAPRRDRRRLV